MTRMARLFPRGLGPSASDTAAYYAHRNDIARMPSGRAIFGDLDTVHGAGHTIPNLTMNGLHIVVDRTAHTITAAAEISGFFGIGGDNQHPSNGLD